MTTLIVSSDWHLDAVTAGVSRFDELAAVVMQDVVRCAIESEGVFIFLGDLCDPDCGVLSWKVSKFIYTVATTLNSEGVQSIWLVGNHDVIEDGTGGSTLSPLQAVGGLCQVANRTGMTTVEGVQKAFRLFPYPSRATAYDPAITARHVQSGDVVLSHLQLKGIVPGIESQEMAKGRDVFLPTHLFNPDTLVLNGHYHTGQRFQPEDGPPVYIPGALARLRFDEEHNTPAFLSIEV